MGCRGGTLASKGASASEVWATYTETDRRRGIITEMLLDEVDFPTCKVEYFIKNNERYYREGLSTSQGKRWRRTSERGKTRKCFEGEGDFYLSWHKRTVF